MAYASLTDLTALQPVFDSSSYDDRVLLQYLESTASAMTRRLARRFTLPISTTSEGAVSVDAVPSDGDTLAIGDNTYRFKDTVAAENDITIGATAAATAINIYRAVNELGSGYHEDTTVNTTVRAVLDSTTITLVARKAGPDGDLITLSTDCADLTLTAFDGGAREFPDLVLVNVQMAVGVLHAGQRYSNAGGGNQEAQVSLSKMADDAITELLAGGALVDTTGTRLASAFYFDFDEADDV